MRFAASGGVTPAARIQRRCEHAARTALEYVTFAHPSAEVSPPAGAHVGEGLGLHGE